MPRIGLEPADDQVSDFLESFGEKELQAAFFQGLDALLPMIRDKFGQVILEGLSKWEPSEQAERQFPYLLNAGLFASNYASCIIWNEKEGGILMTLDDSKIKSFGFPDDITQVLEFGNTQLPAIRPLFKVQMWIEENISKWSETWMNRFVGQLD